MDEEISKQEEAQKILDAIRHKENADGEEQNSSKPISYIPEEDANQLKALVAKKLRLKPDEPVPKLPNADNINPISAEQIKVMRKFATVKEHEKKPLSVAIREGIIRAYFSVVDSFKPPKNK